MPGTDLKAAAVPSFAAFTSCERFADGKLRLLTAPAIVAGSTSVYLLLNILLKTAVANAPDIRRDVPARPHAMPLRRC